MQRGSNRFAGSRQDKAKVKGLVWLLFQMLEVDDH